MTTTAKGRQSQPESAAIQNAIAEQAAAPPQASMAPPQVIKEIDASSLVREIGYGYTPGRSLGVSLLAHCGVMLLLIVVGRNLISPTALIIKPKLQPGDSARLVFFPSLGGGTAGGGRAGGGKGYGQESSSLLRARSRRGFAYPGPQPMISNPPRAVAGIQTILQPPLKLPRLKNYVELQNIFQPMPVMPTLTSSPIRVRPSKHSAHALAPQPPSIRLTVPASARDDVAALMHPESRLPQKAVPDSVDATQLTAGNHRTGLLVLNAVPPPPEVSGNVPRAEARSLFAVSPAEATMIADPSAGTAKGGEDTGASGSGSRANSRTGDALAALAAGNGDQNSGNKGSGTGKGGVDGGGVGAGVNLASGGDGAGRGNTSGNGVGLGNGTGRGSGTGAGSAPGVGGFAGITIQGGRYGNSSNLTANAKPPRQTSYNMTIVSAANGGGGLPDLGVFRNEKVYTVYLDMRSNDDDPAPSWTLEYAVLQPPDIAQKIHGTPTAPFATLKEFPQLAPALVQKCARSLIIASAILDTAGKLQKLSIERSPDTQIVTPVMTALEDWIFEPAKIEGQPVALKVLLGIRLGSD